MNNPKNPKVWQPEAERIEAPRIFALNIVSMDWELAKQIWILLSKDERFMVSKAHGTVSSNSPDLATLFGSEKAASNYHAQLEVLVAAQFRPFPLFEWCQRLVHKRNIQKAEDSGGEPAQEIPR